MSNPVEQLSELLAIVDLDAAPILATLSLAQRELPTALEVCGGHLIDARLRIERAFKVELAHCQARLNSRDVNRAALRKQGLATSLIDGFLGDSAQPSYVGESDPFVSVLRIDWPGVSALVNAQACLLMAPDHWLLTTTLPSAHELLPDLPRTPAARPEFLRIANQADLPLAIDGSGLRSLQLYTAAPAQRLRTLLSEATGLRALALSPALLLDCGLFDEVEFTELNTLELPNASDLTATGCAQIARWPSLKILRVQGLGMQIDNLHLLAQLATAPFFGALTHLTLLLFRARAPLDPTLWASVWEGREFAFNTLQLRFLNADLLSQVWRGRFPHLRVLDISGNDLREQLGAALAGADLPKLEDLDVRGNSLTPPALRAFACTRAFPAMRRIAVAFASDSMEDYRDWNGAVVGRGPLPMGDREIERDWLAGTGLRVYAGVAPD